MQTRAELAGNGWDVLAWEEGLAELSRSCQGKGSPRRSTACAAGTGLDLQEWVPHGLAMPVARASSFHLACGLLSGVWCEGGADQCGGPLHSRAGFILWRHGRADGLTSFFSPPPARILQP